jgi:hypothetical protein
MGRYNAARIKYFSMKILLFQHFIIFTIKSLINLSFRIAIKAENNIASPMFLPIHPLDVF